MNVRAPLGDRVRGSEQPRQTSQPRGDEPTASSKNPGMGTPGVPKPHPPKGSLGSLRPGKDSFSEGVVIQRIVVLLK